MFADLKPDDRKTLIWLAEYRVLTVRQLVALGATNLRTVQRQMKRLLEAGFADVFERSYSRIRGRPGQVFCLSQKGIDCLKEHRRLDGSVSAQKVRWESARSLEHQLSVNWVLIHAICLERFSLLKVKCLTPTSPFCLRPENGQPFVHDTTPSPDGRPERVGFTPEGVIATTHPGLKKTLLFFLEADRSTECLHGTDRSRASAWKKIVTYQSYFRSAGYKRYERTFNCELIGFRLLLVCESAQRFANLCCLVRDTPPSDFVWVTTEHEILARGFGAKIWARGGSVSSDPESVLGPGLAIETPLQ